MSDCQDLIEKISKALEQKLFKAHLESIKKKHSKLSEYNINPFTIKFLKELIKTDENEDINVSIAKALIYPRVLGTSINTKFGDTIINILVENKLAEKIIDELKEKPKDFKSAIKFKDKVDKKNKYCVIKSGPNTLNNSTKKDVITKLEKIDNQYDDNDCIVGILYGRVEELSEHFKKLNNKYDVYIGKDFWHRITGCENFYEELQKEINDVIILSIQCSDVIKKAIDKLAKEIEGSSLFDQFR